MIKEIKCKEKCFLIIERKIKRIETRPMIWGIKLENGEIEIR
jgi:hypothetical protein